MRDSLTFIGAELNSPLTVISSCLSMIQSALSEVNTAEPMPKRLREALPALQTAQRNIVNSQNLMSSFTQSTRAAFSTTEANPIQASRLVQLLITEMPLPEARNSAIKLSLSVNADFSIATKQNLIYLCLLNVMQNAIQAVQNSTQSAAQSPSIEINVMGGTSTATLIGHTISITDNGPGIPAEVLQHLFDSKAPVIRQKLSTGSEGNMGLKFCKKIMRSVNGDLSVNSNQSGTSVILHLPSETKD
jgi:signal transduction histidine kinase